ncbi:MAG: NADH-quinone oxidoreductase subunit C [Candidatus Moduliflexus flocculans]|nr:NADH-quinone oxidoreductase subunit C [Candidatus Moduliflexus flocculans]
MVLRTSAPASDPTFDSITPDIPNAGWSEREYQDLLGMRFTGHPKPKRLILADDWPAGIYPLRKEVPYDLEPPAAEDVAYQLDEAPPGTTIVPIGPFHASLHEPEHFAVYVDGETIKGCDYRGFMTHRGIEKLCQTQVSYNEVPFVAERICGICGSVHAVCYAQAVEAAAGLTHLAPGRVHPDGHARDRASPLAPALARHRRPPHRLRHGLHAGLAGPGEDHVARRSGSPATARPTAWSSSAASAATSRRRSGPSIEGILATLEKEVLVLKNSIIGDGAIHRRTKGVGSLSKEETVRWSLVGPVARARGLSLDTRKDHPYAAYDDMAFDVPVVDSCDVWGTLVVRVLEIFESIGILRQALARMPADGPLLVEIPEALPPLRHAVSMVEAPRGESVHYVITGEENRPERWRVRAPTYPNLQAVPSMLLDNQFADFPIIVGQIDPCFSCTDRVAVVDARSGAQRVLGRAELERMSRRRGGGKE